MRYLYLILVLIAGTASSCVEGITSGDVSSVTNFPVIILNGDEQMVVAQGDAYIEPGAVSTVDGEEVETTTTYFPGVYNGSGGVDTSLPDTYVVSYSAVNADGFSGSALRTVLVIPPTGDLITSIEGRYTSDVQRAPSFTPGPPYDGLEGIFIYKISDNVYGLSHGIGGYYQFGRGYGVGYQNGGGTITANSIPDNDFTTTQGQFPIWGNVCDIINVTVNPETKTITLTGDCNFGNGEFHVQLTQVQ